MQPHQGKADTNARRVSRCETGSIAPRSHAHSPHTADMISGFLTDSEFSWRHPDVRKPVSTKLTQHGA